jgi:hypothetical protein
MGRISLRILSPQKRPPRFVFDLVQAKTCWSSTPASRLIKGHQMVPKSLWRPSEAYKTSCRISNDKRVCLESLNKGLFRLFYSSMSVRPPTVSSYSFSPIIRGPNNATLLLWIVGRLSLLFRTLTNPIAVDPRSRLNNCAFLDLADSLLIQNALP